VTASADSTIRVWNVATQSEIAVLYWHGEAVNYAAFSRDGRMIVSASDDGTVKLGKCGACELGRDELRTRVQETATLPPDELAAINREIEGRR
jgi:WD40 repeat protein